MKNSIDPFTVEVIRHALTAAAEEMSFVVMRSARSPLLREAGDLSSALTDHKGDLIAQIPIAPIAGRRLRRKRVRQRPPIALQVQEQPLARQRDVVGQRECRVMSDE